mgnify:CR=1 FL=1
MKFLIVNDQATLTSMGAVDQTLMFPTDRVICIDSVSDTDTNVSVQGSNDVDNDDNFILKHADKSASSTHKVERNIIDDMVSAINIDSRSGFTVIFDLLNNVKLPNQILTGSTFTED